VSGIDGDPLDVMVCVSEPTFPGCLIDVKPLALFRMEDDQGIDDKLLAVPLTDVKRIEASRDRFRSGAGD
jgi:inorganic pyrophosphatase